MARLIPVLVVIAIVLLAYPFYGAYLPFGPLAVRPTPKPRPTAPPAPPTPSPTPEAWRSDPEHPVNLFVAFMTAEAPTYHVDTTVTAAFINTQVALGESYKVSGNDYAGVATTNNENGVLKIRVVRLGTRLFIKQGSAAWVEQADINPDNVWGATNNDAYSTLQYVGPEVRDGKTVQHIVLNVAGWPVRSTEYMLISQQPQVSKWDVWIDEAGHPVFAQMQGSFHGIVNRASIPIAMLFQYTFSAAGEPVQIELPAGFD